MRSKKVKFASKLPIYLLPVGNGHEKINLHL